jgi:hypothetical protein
VKNLRNKLNSRRGASILLALLFLLVCMMVAASILMAAVSNGGKLGSNREAQQRYLTLSSAITLVSDQLTAAEYQGNYTHTVTDVKKPVITKHPDGTTTTDWVHDYWQHSYKQEDGKFVCALNGPASPVLPLGDNLDQLFAGRFQEASVADRRTGNRYDEFTPKLPVAAVPESYDLTLTLQNPSEDYPGLAGEEVRVRVSFRSTGDLHLLAELDEKGRDGAVVHTHTIQAELRASLSPVELFTLKGGDGASQEGTHSEQTEVLTWTLSWVAKGKEEEP